MAFHKLHLLPMTVAIILPMNIAFTLVLAVIGHHVLPGWPYISDAGQAGKARGMFSILCNIGAFFMAACAYFKFRHVKLWMEDVPSNNKAQSVNLAAFIFGILLAAGLQTAANFQTDNVPFVHRIGAFTGFLSGVVYFALLCWIGIEVPDSTPSRTLKARIVLVVISSIFFFTTIIPGRIAAFKHPANEFKSEWRRTDPGFNMHLTSTISEWFLALMIAYMFLTLVPDFRHMTVESPVVQVRSRME